MRRVLLLVCSALVTVSASCSCGNTATFSCRSDSDCTSGHICIGGECLTGTRTSDGGYVLTDAGTQGGQDSGNPGGGDSGNPGGGDGGCVNLACDIQPCPGVDGGTTLTGIVYDPSGQLPLYNAYVYVPNSTPQPFTDGVTCEACTSQLTGSPLAITLTNYLGAFTLNNVPVGSDIPLVIQIGHWRRQVTVPSVPACTATPVAASLTHMPQDHTQGDIPKMAISTGSADPFECLLLKMGIGAEMKEAGQGGRVDYYAQYESGFLNGTPISSSTPHGTQLFDSLQTLEGYDIVILPCEGDAYTQASPAPQNIVDYTNDGGRLFTTHYGYQWLGTGYGFAPFPNTADWSVEGGTAPNNQTGLQVTLNQTFPKGQAFAEWLEANSAATNGIFSIVQARYDVGTVTTTGTPSYVNPTTAWMFGDPSGNTTGAPPNNYSWTPHMTFNTPYEPPPLADGDAGIECGRVVYSDFHVTTDDQTALCALDNTACTFPMECKGGAYTAQEKALVFMLFDLSSCVQNNAQPPPVCVPLGGACTEQSQCCNGLSCLTGTGAACAGGGGESGCTCYSPIG
jgi:hypothetical protein